MCTAGGGAWHHRRPAGGGRRSFQVLGEESLDDPTPHPVFEWSFDTHPTIRFAPHLPRRTTHGRWESKRSILRSNKSQGLTPIKADKSTDFNEWKRAE